LHSLFPEDTCFWIDLLLPGTEERYARDPERLIREVRGLPPTITNVVIDDVQKVPDLLDIVHYLIESPTESSTDQHKNESGAKRFILTGSSARKLRKGTANLLAGRALAYSLFPLTSFELGDSFNLQAALQYGTLPKIINLRSDSARRKMLETYALTYINEEIRAEQVVRTLAPFRKFLEVAAQGNGKILNFASIAKDVGVDEKTVRKYFEILEDTLIGFFVDAFHHSVRKKVGLAPKFYFFDTGVVRSLARNLTIGLEPGSYAWGSAFEHFIILECKRLITYSCNQFDLNFMRTYDDQEIDLVVRRPGKPLLLVEIKSTNSVQVDHVKKLVSLRSIIDAPADMVVLSTDPVPQMIDGVRCLHWTQGLRELFSGPDVQLPSST